LVRASDVGKFETGLDEFENSREGIKPRVYSPVMELAEREREREREGDDFHQDDNYERRHRRREDLCSFLKNVVTLFLSFSSPSICLLFRQGGGQEFAVMSLEIKRLDNRASPRAQRRDSIDESRNQIGQSEPISYAH